MKESLIHLQDVCFEYEENIPVLKSVSFDIYKGDYTVILGHNGSGKSTIAKLLMGLLEANSGTINIDGLDMTEENLYDIRTKLGIVFQNPDNQFTGATVRDDIAFGLENMSVPQEQMDDIILEYAKKVNMEKFLDHEPGLLSGGQKQRVAIAGCLAMHPDILILDEATSMLDPIGKREINDFVGELNNNHDMTIISISHDIEEAVYASRIILLDQGKVIGVGKPSEILMNEKLMEQLKLGVPFAYQLSKRLKDIGISPTIYIDELEAELCQLKLKI